MNKTFIIGIALILIDRWFRNRDKEEIPSSWFNESPDYWYTQLVGTGDQSLSFEDNVMLYKVMIMKVGDIFDIEGAVIAGIIAKESEGVASKINGRYLGLMQFGLAEAQSMGYKGNAQSLLDPYTNIYWGTAYLKYCIGKRGTLAKGISGYNTGNVEGNPPYRAEYVDDVAFYTERFRTLLSRSFPGYANIFPKETWLKSGIVA